MQFKLWVESMSGIPGFLTEYHALTTQISNWTRDYQGVHIGLDVPNQESHAIHPDCVYLYEIIANAGSGSKALQMITSLADKWHVIIEAHIQPMADKRLDQAWLENWYMSHGFQKVKQELAWGEELWHIVRMPA